MYGAWKNYMCLVSWRYHIQISASQGTTLTDVFMVFLSSSRSYLVKDKGKAVPMHAMKANVGEGERIVPLILNLSTSWDVGGQLHVSVVLPHRKKPWYPLTGRLGGPLGLMLG
jgi:hypothetical protein